MRYFVDTAIDHGHGVREHDWVPCENSSDDCPVVYQIRRSPNGFIYFDHEIAARLYAQWREETRSTSVYVFRVREG